MDRLKLQRAKMAFKYTEGKKNFPNGIPCLRCAEFRPDILWLRPCMFRKNFCLKYGRGMCRFYTEAGKTFAQAERWRKHRRKI